MNNDPANYFDPHGYWGENDPRNERWSNHAVNNLDDPWMQAHAAIGGAFYGALAIGVVAEAAGLSIVGGTPTNWFGVVRSGSGQLFHIGRHPLPMKDLTVLLGRTLAGAVRSRPLIHIGIGARHFPLNPLLYWRAWLGLAALVTANEANSCPADTQ